MELRASLSAGKPSAKKRAEKDGVGEDELEAADDADDIKAAVMARDVSLRADNLVLTVTIAELRGLGSAGLRERLEAEWYVKLRLMKPAGCGWVMVDRPYRTEFYRPVPRGESADAVPISMRFKFPPGPSNDEYRPRPRDEYRINEQLMRHGVLRFKVKAKRLFKFRTVVKSRCAPTASLHRPCNSAAGVLVQRRGALAVLGRGFCRRRGPRGGGARRRAVQWLRAVRNPVASRQVRRCEERDGRHNERCAQRPSPRRSARLLRRDCWTAGRSKTGHGRPDRREAGGEFGHRRSSVGA